MITQQDFEQIQDAIAGKLSADEQQAYNKRLSTDSNFAEDAFLQDKLKNILSEKPNTTTLACGERPKPPKLFQSKIFWQCLSP